jgi:general secretion pathway protein G
MPSSRRPRPVAPSLGRERGFTLIELMVVIVILGLLVAIVAPNVWQSKEAATRDAAKAQMKSIATAIDLYRLAHRRMPPSLAALTVPDPATGEPYLRTLPKDPWGGEYVFRATGTGSDAWSIRSEGTDGREGTEDDLEVPDPVR